MIHPDAWSPADGITLEPNALTAATEIEHSLVLTAGPGAGKTEMLAQRADFLLRTGLCRYPKRILAISFKVDASHNLKERVQRRCGTSLSSRFDSYTFHGFAKRIIDRFRPVLTGINTLDVDYTIGDIRIPRTQITFNDLVPLAIEILRQSTIARNAVRKTYSYVFLDEFQDCTTQQYQLIKEAFVGTSIRLTAVGDTKQMIMGWAGALEGIFISFAEEFNAIPFSLYRNFRSQPKLLRMQNKIIEVMDPRSVMPDDQMEGANGIIQVQHYSNDQAEAIALASQINDWIHDGVPKHEIAILISKQAECYSERLVYELDQLGISYRNEQQLQDLSTEPIVQLIVDYLVSLLDIRKPLSYIRFMQTVTSSATDENEYERLQHAWNMFIMREQKSFLDPQQHHKDFNTIWEYIKRFIKKYGKKQMISLSADYESISRLKAIIKDLKSYLRTSMSTGVDVLTSLSLLTEDQAVRIMTIHKSKGLEFDSVIILGVENETFWGNATAERSAFFVGISRAKKKLILTYADVRTNPKNCLRWRPRRTPHNEFLHYASVT